MNREQKNLMQRDGGGFPIHRTFGASRIEPLESRSLLSVSPLLWANSGQISVSFAPDATDIAGLPSELHAKFDNVASRTEWQQTVLRAFQAWSDVTAVNFATVPDDGTHFGSPGPRVADSRFGDIRIGAIDMANDVAAVSISDSVGLSGTWIGDLVFNSNTDFADTDEVFAVALHEVGHLLGLAHSDATDSAMHKHGDLTVDKLSLEDISQAQAINGLRLHDQYDSVARNDSFDTATFLSPLGNGLDDATQPIILFADITSPSDADFYQIDSDIRFRSDQGPPPKYTGSVSINVQSSEISLLSPSLTLFDEQGKELARAQSTAIGGGTVSVQIDRLDPTAEYFVRVESTAGSPFSVGAYSITTTYDDLLLADQELVDEIVTHRNRGLDQGAIHALFAGGRTDGTPGSNDSFARADNLIGRREFQTATYFDATGAITEDSATDFYRFATPNIESETAILTAFVQSLDEGSLIPSLSVYDHRRELIESHVLANGSGELIVQASIDSNSIYFVKVSAGDEIFSTGDYRMNLSFGNEPVSFDSHVAATLTVGLAQATKLYVAQTQLFHLALEVDATGDERNYVSARVVDSLANAVHQLGSVSGQKRTSFAVLLKPGEYDVIFESVGDSDEVGIRYESVTLSDPFVIEPEDSIEEPSFACPDSDEVFCYPGGIVSPDPFIWDEFIQTLDDLPELDIEELISTTLGGWWSWYWGQRDENGPVLGRDDAYDAYSGLSLTVGANDGVLANDFDPESQAFIAVPSVFPQHGRLEMRPDGGFVYRSNAGFVGTDSFVYNAFDFSRDSAPVTVRINVLPPIADFDSDLLVTETDIDRLSAAVRSGDGDVRYDLNGDSRVSMEDHQYLVGDLLNTSAGDANLDGVFNSQDFVIVFAAALYESDSAEVAGWRVGDWNGDGRFTSSDLVAAFRAGRYVSAARPVSFQVAAAISVNDTAIDDSDHLGVKLDTTHRKHRQKELVVV